MKTIKPGDVLKTRSTCDYNCIFEVKVLERNKSFVKVHVEGQDRRVKVHFDSNGDEFIYAMGRFSMCPIFRAIT